MCVLSRCNIIHAGAHMHAPTHTYTHTHTHSHTHTHCQSCDTIDNINQEVIEQMTQATASVLEVSLSICVFDC